ncbi:YdcF family protein [Pedobacter chinensis]|uniref:YdcF family protein n=1 Tax=Pedobacter chinensis TaxID=2282421 RepID=A0A369PUC1_9SPHI|nr:YdcF family protein [Pedobacter chinensis]RDC56124.1 YdcF family protein [Pedobacter chinensis]
MSFILSKILIFLLKPIVWVLITMAFSIRAKSERKRKKFLFISLGLLVIFSNPFVCSCFFNLYEPRGILKKKYDVGILLGGFSKPGPENRLEITESGDRLAQTILLYKTGVIKKILISGGSGKIIGTEPIEADLAADYLKCMGIPDSSIIMENKSRNTIENAKLSLGILNKMEHNPTVVVITSAWHIPRSKVIFNHIFEQKPDFYPTNYLGNHNFNISDFIVPDANALSHWEILLKEWVGYIVDSIRVKGF